MSATAAGGAPRLVVVGSVALDTVGTPSAERSEMLGGSASYACAAAALFTRVGMVGVVGTDFPPEHIALYEKLGIDLDGLQRAPGKTFRWSGVYEADMINRRTLATELNVFANFCPTLPPSYAGARYVLLGNIAPDLQIAVLDQIPERRFVVADTMDLWIRTARERLTELMRRVDMVVLNDGEARLLTGRHDLRACATAILGLGPGYVVIKKGEHGAMLFHRDLLLMVPAYPVGAVCDPTGAGDVFAGAFMGALAAVGTVEPRALREALLTGSVVASFAVEDFGLDRLRTLSRSEVGTRLAELKAMICP
jgi:sugar/nucleoside kinase (ribokinase family)